MSILGLLVVIIVFCLLWYLVSNLLPIPSPFRLIFQVVIIILFILWLLNLAGFLSVPLRF